MKTSAENSNRQPNVGRSAGNSKPQRKIEKFSGKIKFVAENLQLPLKIQMSVITIIDSEAIAIIDGRGAKRGGGGC